MNLWPCPVSTAEFWMYQRHFLSAAGLVEIGRSELAGEIECFHGISVIHLQNRAAPCALIPTLDQVKTRRLLPP